MEVLRIIYQIIIAPLELLFSIIYGYSYQILRNPGLAVVPVSLAINLLLLPLYLRAESIQKEIRLKEQSMASMVKHIKNSFKGDEKYMMLQTYYRIKHYKPVDSLKGSLSLFLQIPFFLAAYRFLSESSLMDGAELGLITDLSKPDALLRIGGFTINILPILMTIVNIISSRVYFKSYSKKEKIQSYGLALVFLILLYNSPSGLVIYWLLNNLFSYGKNIVLQTKNPRLILDCFLMALGLILVGLEVYSFYKYTLPPEIVLVMIMIIIMLMAPLSMRLIKTKWKADFAFFNHEPKAIHFVLGCLLLAVLSGMLIPSSVIGDSPTEFIIIKDYQTPLIYMVYSFSMSIGVFVLWLLVFYQLSKDRIRVLLELAVWIASGVSLVNYLFFGTKLGIILPLLQYEKGLQFSGTVVVINMLVCLLVASLLFLIWKVKKAIIPLIYLTAIIIMLGMSMFNCNKVVKQTPEIKRAVERSSKESQGFTLSATGKNIVVLVLDKAVGGLVPYIFNEKPELKQQFAGFIWYPNTISYGNMTNVGSPALYGGYEYTPEAINKRNDEWLGDKQNEALRIMPALFDKEGFDVTVCDPPYAGYKNISDLSIYDGYNNTKALLLDNGVYREQTKELVDIKKNIWKRNFFCFGLMKMLPLCFQKSLYQDGTYFYDDTKTLMGIEEDKTKFVSVGGLEEFTNAYSVLRGLPDLTDISSESKGAFLMLHNMTTHSPVILQEPEYEPKYNVDNSIYDSENKDRFTIDGRTLRTDDIRGWAISHYHSNVAALIQVGNWLDYLKEQGVYDNTRIIIVADHGAALNCFDDMRFGNKSYEDVLYYNPLLMVKDFNSRSDFSSDETFMTNADTPVLAFAGIVLRPINPFTGELINNSEKYKDEQHIVFSSVGNPDSNNGNTFLPGEWYSLKNHNIFDMRNWEYLGNY